MLTRKPFAERSPAFQWFAETKNRHNSRWNFLADGHWDHGHFVVPTKGGSRATSDGGERSEIFGHTTHILGVGSRVANLYWQRFQYTMDTNWLRQAAYPMIRDAAEFYRNFPNFGKGPDGQYHIRHVNNGESQWNSSDTAYEVACLHAIFPLAIRASEILGTDEDLRPVWREINDHLVAMPARRYPGGGDWSPAGTNAPTVLAEETNRVDRPRRDNAFGAFVYGGPGGIEPIGPEPELKHRFLGFNRTASFIDERGGGGAQIFRNRLRLREGPGAIDAEHLGGLVSGIHVTLLSSSPDTVDGGPVLSIFNSWPKDWEASFELLARGGFLVSSSQRNGQVEFVEVHSRAGETCSLRNPWGDAEAHLFRDGRSAERVSGPILKFPTSRNETIVIVRASAGPVPSRRSLPEPAR
jgi:hypothetical protein